jgi:hypothetical protein
MSTDHSDPFDPDALRLSSELQRLARTGTARAQSRKWKRQFIRFPWAWMDALKATDRSQTYRLALLLVYEHWRAGGRAIVLSNVALKAEGISARSKSNALRELERLGLIKVQRRRRQAPRVTLLLDSR